MYWTTARNRLAIIWFSTCLPLIALVAFQSIYGKYGDKVHDFWDWLTPNIFPTLTIILGTLAAQALTPKNEIKVNTSAFWAACAVSILYLIIIWSIVLCEPFVTRDYFEILRQSKVYLTILQGMTGISLGVFFGSGKSTSDD